MSYFMMISVTSAAGFLLPPDKLLHESLRTSGTCKEGA